jgi:nucleoside-diphosphate-sugar epimerase
MSRGATVIVTGASSQLGVFLLPRLVAEGRSVLAVSRNAPDEPVSVVDGLKWVSPAGIPASGFDALVSCGPIRLAGDLVESGRVSGKAVVFSTSSKHTKSDSDDRAERERIASIAGEEVRIKALCESRRVALVVIRPTLVFGCGLDGNLSLLLGLGERIGFIPVSRRAMGRRQPVHADDLAGLATVALTTDTGPYFEGEACGGSTLTYREMVERLASCGERRIRPLALPESPLFAMVSVASKLGPWRGINPEMVRRQARDMVFDDTPFRAMLGWDPRPFEPTAADFRIQPGLDRYRLSR